MFRVFSLSFKNVRGDFFGGLTAGIVALPLALAFGEQTELGAIAGLYGAIAIGILAAYLGGTATQVSGPTAPMTVVSAMIITEAVAYMNGDLTKAVPIIIATFILAGFIESMMGVIKLGKYIKYIPYPVVSGFMSGIGVIIVITQIFPFFGAGAPPGGPMGTINNLGQIPEILNYYSIGVALLTIAIIYILPRFTKAVPSALVSLVVVSVMVFLLLPPETVLIIESRGPIPTGLPKLQLEFISVFTDFDHIKVVLQYAFTLAALGAIDSLLTSVVADNMTKTKHDSDQELIGQGIGNMVAGVIGGLPGAGATMRTVININSGGKTKLSGMIAGFFLLLVLLGIGPLVGKIPNAVLAGILITVGIGIVDYKGMRHLTTIPRSDAFVMIAVLLLTVFVDLLIAVGVGMVLASVLFMKHISDVAEQKAETNHLREFSREVAWQDEGDIIDRIGDKVYIKHLDGPLFFGFVSRFQDMVKALPDIKVVIIRMEKVPYVDQSGLYAMEDGVMDMYNRKVAVVFTGLHGQPRDMFERINLVPGLVPEKYCFETFADCTAWLEEHLKGDGSLDDVFAKNEEPKEGMNFDGSNDLREI